MKYSAKYIHRTFTAFVALMSLVSLLVTQMAVAAHPCPLMPVTMAVLANVVSGDIVDTSDADDMARVPACHSPLRLRAGSPPDSGGNAALCQQHCTADHRIVGDADFKAPIQFVPAYEITLAPLAAIAENGSIAFDPTLLIGLRYPVEPPPILAFGQLRL